MFKKTFIYFLFAFIPLLEANLIDEMSIEEKIGQLMIVHFKGDVENEEAKTLIQEMHVGGFIYYNWANELKSPEKVQLLSSGLQKLALETRHSIPVFIAIDQEGGIVSRLTDGFTIFPGNRAIAETNDPELAEKAAFIMGKELEAVGINLNFAPVVDINSHPKNPIIGLRSFGEDPEKVISFGKKMIDGYKRAGMIATLKHYPGHGDVEVDSHKDLPIVNKSLDLLEETELLPFTTLSPFSEMIMTAHLLVPALDKDNCTTLSEKSLNYLKSKIKFKGVIISDSLVMKGVLKKYGTVEATAIEALKAGCDLLLFGGRELIEGETKRELSIHDFKNIHQALVEAVKKGRISKKRVDEAFEKVIDLKKRYLQGKYLELKPDLSQLIRNPHHLKIAKKIAEGSLKIIHQKPNSIPSLKNQKITIFSPKILENSLKETSLSHIGKTTDFYFYEGLNPSLEEIKAAKEQMNHTDLLFICSYNCWKNPSQKALIETLIESQKPVILLVARDSLDVPLFPKANLILNTFSPTTPSIEAVVNHLKNNF